MKRRGFCRQTISLLEIFIPVLLIAVSAAHAEWTVVTPPNISADWSLAGVQFISSSEGWAVGQDFTNKKGVLLHFLDGAWTSVTPPAVSTNWGLVSVQLISSTEGWAVGQDTTNKKGVLLRYSAGAWTSVPPPTISSDWHLVGIHFTSSTEGWAVGQDSTNKKGVLLHYSAGAWTAATTPSVSSDWHLAGVHFTSSSEGWAVGEDSFNKNGVLLHYSNTAWTHIQPPEVSTDWNLLDVQLLSSTEGWAVGQDSSNKKGVLLHYSDGDWTPIESPEVSTDWGLVDVQLLSSGEGWAVGQDSASTSGVLLHYLNDAWETVTPPDAALDWSLEGIDFISAIKGWAVGHRAEGSDLRGLLLKYTSPDIKVSPTDIVFQPDVTIGAFLEQTVKVSNNGSADLTIGAITSPSLPFATRVDQCSGQTLARRQSCEVTYRFAPAEAGAFLGSSDIPHNDPGKSSITVILFGRGVAGPPTYIHLLNPSDGQDFTACSYFAPPTLQWDPSETFKQISIQFSVENDFSGSLVSAKGKRDVNELLSKSSLWKKVLLLPGAAGGRVYWRVVGTKTDTTLVESDVFSFIVGGPEAVEVVAIPDTSKTSDPPPTLSWENNCNVKFKVWFSNDPDFTKKGVKKKGLSYRVKNPDDNGGMFVAELTSGQWTSIRKVVGDIPGSTIYWYVESWDKLKRFSQTGLNSFVLTD